MDPQVEQFYEALVGTLKSAKKRGLITFKGQILLKGMHDKVNVSIVGVEGDGRNPSSITNSEKTANNNNTGDNSDRVQPVRRWKPKTTNGFSSGVHQGNHWNAQKTVKLNSPEIVDNSNSQNDGEGDKSENRTEDVHTPLKQYSPRTLPRSTSKRSTSKRSASGARKPKFILDAKLSRDVSALNLTSNSATANDDDGSVHSFATAPTPTGFRSPNSDPSKTPKPKIDVIHSKAVGTTFQSTSFAETHSERVEREVQQLLVDIRRIEPSTEPYCKFGDLFVDERVEQYYEALVGKWTYITKCSPDPSTSAVTHV